MKKVYVCGYIRVSTEDQIEGYSLQEQEHRIRCYAEANGWTIKKIYSDPGISGAIMDRPGLTEMIKDIKAGQLEKVIVYKLDRLSRRQRDVLYIIEDIFIPSGIDFISITEQIVTDTPLGRAMIGILSAFAQLERDTIRQRSQMGLEARAKAGYYHGGGVDPIGYDYKDDELIVNPYEAMQVKEIYEMYLTGASVTSILKMVQEKGYTKKYGKWRESAIRSVLFTRLYKGVIVWNGEEYQGRHEPLVSEHDWNKVQAMKKARMEKNPRGPGNPFKRTSMLGGLIWCGNCGALYYTKTNVVKRGKTTDPNKKPLRYYTCYSRGKSSKHMIKDSNCKNPSYNMHKLDAVVLDQIRQLAIDPNMLDDMTEGITTQTDNREIYKDRLIEIDKQIEKLIDLYQLGNIDISVINKKIDALNAEKKKLTAEIETTPTPAMSLDEARDVLKDIPEALDSLDDEGIKSIVHSLINSIFIMPDGSIEIHWKFI